MTYHILLFLTPPTDTEAGLLVPLHQQNIQTLISFNLAAKFQSFVRDVRCDTCLELGGVGLAMDTGYIMSCLMWVMAGPGVTLDMLSLSEE